VTKKKKKEKKKKERKNEERCRVSYFSNSMNFHPKIYKTINETLKL